MKSKEQQIQETLAKPFAVGDYVDINVPDKNDPKKIIKHGSGTIESIKSNGDLEIDSTSISNPHTYDRIFPAAWCSQSISNCGANPFKKVIDLKFHAAQLEGLMFYAGYSTRNDLEFGTPKKQPFIDTKTGIKGTYGGINFDPTVKDADGKEYNYQRPLVWTLEDKQLLIESIYSGIEIGKFIIKENSWEQILEQVKKTGHGYDFDCVDGKQRLNAIIEFCSGKFQDLHGNYWKDLSKISHRIFQGYNKLALGMLSESSTDKDVLNTFLTLNFTGKVMSKEHIDYVKSIKI